MDKDDRQIQLSVFMPELTYNEEDFFFLYYWLTQARVMFVTLDKVLRNMV